MHIYTVTMKSGPDLWLVNVFAWNSEEAKEAAELRTEHGRAIKAVRATRK